MSHLHAWVLAGESLVQCLFEPFRPAQKTPVEHYRPAHIRHARQRAARNSSPQVTSGARRSCPRLRRAAGMLGLSKIIMLFGSRQTHIVIRTTAVFLPEFACWIAFSTSDRDRKSVV